MKFLSKLSWNQFFNIFQKSLLFCGLFFVLGGESMEVKCINELNDKPLEVLVIPCFKEQGKVETACVPDKLSMQVNPVIDLGDFHANSGETLLLYTKDFDCRRILLLGLGEKEELTKEGLRRSIACSVKALISKELTQVGIYSFSHEILQKNEICYLIAESFHLTNYAFNRYKIEPASKKNSLSSLLILTDCQCDKTLEEVSVLTSSVNHARDLVNGNADDVTPRTLLDFARSIETNFKTVKVTAFDHSEIKKRKMGLFEAVARASSKDPYFIIVSYNGNKGSQDHSVIIGKGITYDTGGLSLKPTSGMDIMKCDMGGAAAVLGAIKAIASMKLPVNVTAIVAATENAIGSLSYKPGDVYIGYTGKTVEIKNTDAEGRLALADSISYAIKELAPTRVIDLATLTGAAEVALGSRKSPLFSNSDDLANALFQAGEDTGERLWRMPLDEDYKELTSSKIADLKNVGSRSGSLMLSAMFLSEFAENTPWAHIDIAGPAFLDSPREYHRSQATGVGVRLLYELFRTHLQECNE